MTTPAEFRKYADECLNWARSAKTDAERQQFLEMASAWLKAASIQDGKPAIADSSDLRTVLEPVFDGTIEKAANSPGTKSKH